MTDSKLLAQLVPINGLGGDRLQQLLTTAVIEDLSAGLDPRRRYVVYGDTGRRSTAAAILLSERGFEVAVPRDGISALVRANPAAA